MSVRTLAAHGRRAVRGLIAVGALSAAFTAPSQDAPPPRPTRHALVIGIGDYLAPGVPALKGVPHDLESARRMARAMAVPEGNVRIVRDGEATAARIRAELDALDSRVRDGDRVFVYYSGHGTRWLDPSTGPEGGACTEGLVATDGQVLSNLEIGQRLAPISRRADKMLVFYDACFSGGVAGAPFRTRSVERAGSGLTPKFTPAGAPAACAQPSNFRTRSLALALPGQAALPQTVVHVAASRPDEVSFDQASRGGLATVAWRDCLLGDARDLDGSGAITVDEVTRCARAKLGSALAAFPDILGQNMVVHGNASFVPAWISAPFSTPAAPTLPALSVPTRPVAPAQILAELHAQRDEHRPVAAVARRSRLVIGRDPLELDITPSRDGYLYLALAGSDGQSLYLLYPNELAPARLVKAGERVSLPGPGWEIVAGGPPGTETLLVLLTDAPRDLTGLARESAGPFMKTLLDASGRARLQAILANGTPAPNCGRPGAPPCSDAFGSALLQIESVR
jgi:hypothetical protein